MAVDDEGDREGDDDGNHHPAGLKILVRTVADIRGLLLGSVLYREGSELALCSLFIATLFPGWVCLPHLQFWLRLNGGHISRS